MRWCWTNFGAPECGGNGGFPLLCAENKKFGVFSADFGQKFRCEINSVEGVSPAWKKQGGNVFRAGEGSGHGRGTRSKKQGRFFAVVQEPVERDSAGAWRGAKRRFSNT